MDQKVVACNLVEGNSACRARALAYIRSPNPGNHSDRIELMVRSRSGRWIMKWEARKNLTHFRMKTVPPENPLQRDERFHLCFEVSHTYAHLGEVT